MQCIHPAAVHTVSTSQEMPTVTVCVSVTVIEGLMGVGEGARGGLKDLRSRSMAHSKLCHIACVARGPFTLIQATPCGLSSHHLTGQATLVRESLQALTCHHEVAYLTLLVDCL